MKKYKLYYKCPELGERTLVHITDFEGLVRAIPFAQRNEIKLIDLKILDDQEGENRTCTHTE